MAIINSSNQYKYTNRGPIDPKSLVKTYADLLSETTWQITNSSGKKVTIAYNGMLTAVWLNKADTTKNGVYFLYDPEVTTPLAAPDVKKEANWHKLIELSDLVTLTNQLSSIESELTGVKTKLASLEADKVVIRRDNEYNYNNKLVVANDEICLVDVPGHGLRVKIGDGKSTFEELPYIDDTILTSSDTIIVKGYFYQGQFYSDAGHTVQLDAKVGCIYIDTASSKLYIYSGLAYVVQKASLPNANAQIKNTFKLYDETGKNTDGTMTQRAITTELDGINDELDDKIEMAVDKDSELLIFAPDLD